MPDAKLPADDDGLPPLLTRADFDTDEEYREYLETETADWSDVPPMDPARAAELKAIADVTIAGQRTRITLSIPERNLSRLKAEALRQGLPYQTLINWILQQHLNEGAAR